MQTARGTPPRSRSARAPTSTTPVPRAATAWPAPWPVPAGPWRCCGAGRRGAAAGVSAWSACWRGAHPAPLEAPPASRARGSWAARAATARAASAPAERALPSAPTSSAARSEAADRQCAEGSAASASASAPGNRSLWVVPSGAPPWSSPAQQGSPPSPLAPRRGSSMRHHRRRERAGGGRRSAAGRRACPSASSLWARTRDPLRAAVTWACAESRQSAWSCASVRRRTAPARARGGAVLGATNGFKTCCSRIRGLFQAVTQYG